MTRPQAEGLPGSMVWWIPDRFQKRSGLALFALSPSEASFAHHLETLVLQPYLLRGVTWKTVNILLSDLGEVDLLAVELHCTPQVKWRGGAVADGHTASNTPDLF